MSGQRCREALVQLRQTIVDRRDAAEVIDGFSCELEPSIVLVKEVTKCLLVVLGKEIARSQVGRERFLGFAESVLKTRQQYQCFIELFASLAQLAEKTVRLDEARLKSDLKLEQKSPVQRCKHDGEELLRFEVSVDKFLNLDLM